LHYYLLSREEIPQAYKKETHLFESIRMLGASLRINICMHPVAKSDPSKEESEEEDEDEWSEYEAEDEENETDED
jgi:hypothetical protein